HPDPQLDAPALPDDPALRLADPDDQPGVLPRGGGGAGPGVAAMAPTGGVVGPAADPHLVHPAGAGAGRPEDLYRGVAAGRGGGRLPPGPRAGTAASPLAAPDGAEHAGPGGTGPAPGRMGRRQRPDQ